MRGGVISGDGPPDLDTDRALRFHKAVRDRAADQPRAAMSGRPRRRPRSCAVWRPALAHQLVPRCRQVQPSAVPPSAVPALGLDLLVDAHHDHGHIGRLSRGGGLGDLPVRRRSGRGVTQLGGDEAAKTATLDHTQIAPDGQSERFGAHFYVDAPQRRIVVGGGVEDVVDTAVVAAGQDLRTVERDPQVQRSTANPARGSGRCDSCARPTDQVHCPRTMMWPSINERPAGLTPVNVSQEVRLVRLAAELL